MGHQTTTAPTRKFSQPLLLSLQVAKVPLCLLVAFSSLFGYYFYPHPNGDATAVFIAVLLLSCGAASLNSYQERKLDALMARTQRRPLVLRQLSTHHAVLQALVLCTAGLAWLFAMDTRAGIAGSAGVVLYNFCYTPLKGRTIASIIPGAFCGAIPPYMGWLAAGGEAVSFPILLPIAVMFFWQIPHFFLVLFNHQNDYLHSSTPNFLKSLSEEGLKRVTLSWVSALVTIMIGFAVIPSGMGVLGRVLVVVNGAMLLGVFVVELLLQRQARYKLLFQYLNVSIFLLMLIVCGNI